MSLKLQSPTSLRFFAWLPTMTGMLIFAVSVCGTYIYDDVPIAGDDPRLTQPGTWGTYLTKDYNFDIRIGEGSIDNLYRPITSLSFAVERMTLGAGAWHFHLVNVLLFGVCCWLVTRLGQLLFGQVKVALVAGLLFAVHPVHTEVVATVVGRADLLCLIAIVGALVLHLGGPPTYRRTAGIGGLLLLALGSKEQGLLLPALLLAAEFLRRRRAEYRVQSAELAEKIDVKQAAVALEYQTRGEGAKAQMSPLKALLMAVCFLTGGYIVLREQILGLKFWWDRSFLDPAVQPMIWAEGRDRMLMPFVLLGRYVHQLVWPGHLSLDYSGRVIGWTVSMGDPYLWVGVAAAMAFAAVVVWALVRREFRMLLVLSGFGLTYGVVSNSFSLIGVNYAERLIFVPSAFFCLGVGALVARAPARAVSAVTAVVVMGAGLYTARYAARWNDAESFYTWSLANQPKSIRLHQLVADRLTVRGEFDEAARVAASGRAVFPEYFAIWTQSGTIEEARGNWDEAERCFAAAARINPQTSTTAYIAFKGRRAATQKAATQP